MESNTFLTILAIVMTAIGIVVTISIFILTGLKKSNTDLWVALREQSKEYQDYKQDSTKEMANFKEHVALHYVSEQRANEKIEASRQHLDSALSGINRRLGKLEDEGSQALKCILQIGAQMDTVMDWMKTSSDRFKKNNDE